MARSWCRLQTIDAGELREEAHPQEGDEHRAEPADQHGGNGAEPGGGDAGFEIAERVRGAGEQRVDRADAAPHSVGRRDLHQREADDTLIESDAPSAASAASESAKEVDSAKSTVDSPKATTAANMMRPTWWLSGWRARTTDIVSAPSAGAERNRPRPHGPVARMSRA